MGICALTYRHKHSDYKNIIAQNGKKKQGKQKKFPLNPHPWIALALIYWEK
jgi:hypothetical protein